LALHLLNQSRMSSVGEIETLDRVAISDKSIARSFSALSATDLHTGPNSSSEFEVGDFRHRWQAMLGNLQACEESSCKDTPEKNEEAAAPASAQPAGLSGNRDPLANRASESSPQSARLSESAGARRRNPLCALPSDRLSLSPGANRRPPNTRPHDSLLRSQNLFGGNNRSAKIETTADSFTTISATNLEFPLTLAILPIQVPLSDAVKYPRLSSSTAGIHDPISGPTGKPCEAQTTAQIDVSTSVSEVGGPILASSPSAEPDGDTLSVGSSSGLGSGVASGESGLQIDPSR
jgi:hypothetical protein